MRTLVVAGIAAAGIGGQAVSSASAAALKGPVVKAPAPVHVVVMEEKYEVLNSTGGVEFPGKPVMDVYPLTHQWHVEGESGLGGSYEVIDTYGLPITYYHFQNGLAAGDELVEMPLASPFGAQFGGELVLDHGSFSETVYLRRS